MKRSNLKPCIVATAMFAVSLVANAQYNIPSDDEFIFDQTPWEQERVLRLFSTAWEEGRTYPSAEELNSIGMNYIDLESARSHTRYRNIDKDSSRDLIADINHDRRLWCNIPAGNGAAYGGYPSSRFDQDVFSFWNYTHLFGPSNYMSLRTPGCWVDAAHKNGTKIYCGVKVIYGLGDIECDLLYSFIQDKNADGSYKYSRTFVNAAAYFGYDGYNYYDNIKKYQTRDWQSFHSEIIDHAHECGFNNFSMGLHPEDIPAITPINVGRLYGTSKGQIFNCTLSVGLNKMAWEEAESSIKTAMDSVGNADGVYMGCIVSNNSSDLSTDYWTEMNTEATKPMNIALLGDFDQSYFFRCSAGVDPIIKQENYQKLLEKAFSGANRNPLHRPVINNDWGTMTVSDASLADAQFNNAPGFCSMIPEHSAIDFALPFETHFSLGNGESYFYKGKVTHGSWYNMSQQDIVPTYRWLITKKGDMTAYSDDIEAHFTHEDAYIGGSSLKLTGATTSGADVILYRTSLEVTESDPMATLAVKGTKGETNLSVIIKKRGNSGWIEVPFGALSGETWEKKSCTISGLAKGDVIENIGLRVNSANKGYEVYVGQLKISDNRNAVHAGIREGSLIAEVCQEYTTQLSLRLGWEPNFDGFDTHIDDFGMVYNDEINVDHFEVFYKEGEDGPVREVGRTSQWATFIGNLPCGQNTDAYIGVRSVSVDLKHYSSIEWIRIPHSKDRLPELSEEDREDNTWAETYTARRDKGEPMQPDNINGGIYGTDIETIDTATDCSSVSIVDGVAYFYDTEKAWFYDSTGRCVKYVDGAESANVSDLNGVYLVKLLNKQIIRPTKVVIR
ncbi:MAG: endo-beta-N-acetylglucosaminidase [Bacteroides sp.]|nr:endo-beta-N-acetylglucosaminidase [Bacteroides sp.]